MQRQLSIRIDAENLDHHLWNNYGVWWIHYTVHENGLRVRRVRCSLGTRDRAEARRMRDAIFATLGPRQPSGGRA
ncbi:MAG: hypothetical protein H6831_03850 [Planctomycetes bacterium]|nr:hypothetical protein [Planctomycetota bacterium]